MIVSTLFGRLRSIHVFRCWSVCTDTGFFSFGDGQTLRVGKNTLLPYVDGLWICVNGKCNIQSERRTAQRYFVNRPIQVSQSRVHGFFNNFFKDYVYRWSMKKQGEQFSRINTWASYDSTMSVMRNLPWLKTIHCANWFC